MTGERKKIKTNRSEAGCGERRRDMAGKAWPPRPPNSKPSNKPQATSQKTLKQAGTPTGRAAVQKTHAQAHLSFTARRRGRQRYVCLAYGQTGVSYSQAAFPRRFHFRSHHARRDHHRASHKKQSSRFPVAPWTLGTLWTDLFSTRYSAESRRASHLSSDPW